MHHFFYIFLPGGVIFSVKIDMQSTVSLLSKDL